jgi:hypothetical protein
MREDLEKASYDNLYKLMQHYSSQLFNGRVSIITICVLLWAYILGVGKDLNDKAISIGSLTVSTKMLVAYFACYLLPMFSWIENAYFRRLLAIVKCGKVFERKFAIESYFTVYSPIKLHPFFFFYVLNIAAFLLLFIFMLWNLNGFWNSFWVTISLCIPIAILVWSHVDFRKRERDVDKVDSVPEEA